MQDQSIFPEGAKGKLMAAALPIFLRDGVSGCRVEELFEVSGVSNGSFYHHFGNKPKLASAMYLGIQEKYHKDFLAALSAAKTARQGVFGIIKHHIAWVASDVRRATYLFQCLEPEVLALCKAQEAQATREFTGVCVEWLSAHAAKQRIQLMSPVEWHILWMGPTLELTRNWLRSCSLKNFEKCDDSILRGLEQRLGKNAWESIGKPS